MKQSKYLNDLIDALTTLPGVGKKSAQRMAYKLMRSNKEKTLNLSEKLSNVTSQVANCSICGIYLDLSDTVMQNDSGDCQLCIDEGRDVSKICVTESPADVYTIDSSTNYKGYYFVLDGNLSPLDGRGPVEIGIKRLEARLEKGNIAELILQLLRARQHRIMSSNSLINIILKSRELRLGYHSMENLDI